MKRLLLAAAAALALTAPVSAQSHSPVCESERVKAKAAIAVMDQESDWIKWYIGTRSNMPGTDKAVYSTAVMHPHDLRVIQARKERAAALQVMLDNQCFAPSSEAGFRETIRKDQAEVSALESEIETDEHKKQKNDADFAKLDPCAVLYADVQTFKLIAGANAKALVRSNLTDDRRKELALDTVRGVDEVLPEIKAKGQGCGMTPREVETTVDELTEARKLYSWALP